MGKLFAPLMALCLAACSSTPKILPRNELNEPVMHQTHYASVGGGLMTGASLSVSRRFDSDGPWYDDGGSWYFQLQPNPLLFFERTVASWASFSFLPLYWNLLLTGDQYADSASLKTGKLHLALHGGLAGVTYSQREEWLFPTEAVLTGKYLVSQRFYLAPTAGLEMPSHRDLGTQARYGELVAGWQLREEHSFNFGSRVTSFAIASDELYHKHWEAQRGEQGLLDGDVWTSFWLGNSNYHGGRHVWGTRISYTWVASDFLGYHDYRVGAWYRFVFR